MSLTAAFAIRAATLKSQCDAARAQVAALEEKLDLKAKEISESQGKSEAALATASEDAKAKARLEAELRRRTYDLELAKAQLRGLERELEARNARGVKPQKKVALAETLKEMETAVHSRDWESVLETSTRALEIDPKCDRAYLARGGAKGNLHHYKSAILDLTRAIELAPERTVAYRNRGVAHLALADPTAALADFDRAIALAPGEGTSHVFRAEARIMLGDLRAAEADLDQARKVLPPDDGGLKRVRAKLAARAKRDGD